MKIQREIQKVKKTKQGISKRIAVWGKGLEERLLDTRLGIFVRLVRECKQDNISAYAAQATYFLILSAIPFLMVQLSMLKYTPFGKDALVKLVTDVFPGYLVQLSVGVIEEVYAHSVGVLSVTALVAVWSAAKGLQYLADGLNFVYHLKEDRNWFVLRFWAILYTLVFAVSLMFLLGFVVFGGRIKQLLFSKLPQSILWIFQGSWVNALVSALVLMLFFAVIYTALPNRKLKFKNQLFGAAFSAAGWLLFSYGLSVYVNYFNGFSMYGSLTTIVLLMLWVYFCMYIMLLGAELNAFKVKNAPEKNS